MVSLLGVENSLQGSNAKICHADGSVVNDQPDPTVEWVGVVPGRLQLREAGHIPVQPGRSKLEGNLSDLLSVPPTLNGIVGDEEFQRSERPIGRGLGIPKRVYTLREVLGATIPDLAG